MADALDLLTLAEAKTAVNQSGVTTYDVELAAWVTGVSRRLDKAVGPVVQRTVTAELQDGGREHVFTNLYPVTSFTTVKEYVDTTSTTLTRETNATKPDSAYLIEPYAADPTLFSGKVRRRGGGSDVCFAVGARNVELTYVAGRSASTSAVDELFKTAARLFIQHLWNANRPSTGSVGEFEIPQANWPRFAVPNAVKELLTDFWQSDARIG